MTMDSATTATSAWRASDLRHHLHPFTDTRRLAAEGGSRVITHAEGVYLTDSDGHRILDAMAGLWCVNVGYGRSELAETAYRQMLELPYYNTFFKTATPPSIELSARLAELAPEGLEHVFFGVSGSDANDTIVRLVRHYWNLAGRPEKKTIISRHLAYHGSTLAGASLTGMAFMHAQADLPLPGFEHVMPPYWYDYGGDLAPEDFGREAARALEARILELGPERVAAFIGEPIMGSGGVIVPPDSYWPEVQAICRRHDVLLIADEVICGFGRTGHWFGSQLYGIEPDVMTLAKGITSGYLPLSAVMLGGRIARTLVDDGGEFAHGYTYSGHPVSCAVALKNLEIMEREGLVERVREDTGPYLQKSLRQLAEHPLVGEVRGVGMIAGLELVRDKAARAHFEPLGEVGLRCREICFRNGLVMRSSRDVMLVSPPLVFEKAHVDELVEKAWRCFDETARELELA